MSKLVNFRWDEAFIEQIDKARGSTPRSVYVRRTVEAALRDETPRPSLDREVRAVGREAKTEAAKRRPARPAAAARQGASRPVASPQPAGKPCSTCAKFGPPKSRPCPKCGAKP